MTEQIIACADRGHQSPGYSCSMQRPSACTRYGGVYRLPLILWAAKSWLLCTWQPGMIILQVPADEEHNISDSATSKQTPRHHGIGGIGGIGGADGASSQLQAYGNPVSDWQNGRKQAAVGIDQAIEFAHSFGILVVIALCYPTIPQNIVGNEESAFSNSGDRLLESVRVLILVHIVEDQIELPFNRLEQIHRIACKNVYAV